MLLLPVLLIETMISSTVQFIHHKYVYEKLKMYPIFHERHETITGYLSNNFHLKTGL